MDSDEQSAIRYLKVFAVVILLSFILIFIPYASIADFVLGIVSMIVLLLAFRELSKNDRQFRTPFIFSVLALVGLIILFAASFIMFGTAFLSAGMLGLAYAILLFSGMMLILLGVGAILLIVGSIVGMILGLWRVGKKYNSSIISVGSILLIFPLVDIVGAILLVVGLLSLK